eukprot:1176323-Prorocentrum_minimum.AAC.1
MRGAAGPRRDESANREVPARRECKYRSAARCRHIPGILRPFDGQIQTSCKNPRSVLFSSSKTAPQILIAG